MRTLYRRLFLSLCFILILMIVAIGAAFFGRNFMGIGPVPTRSAFASRLPGTVDGKQRRFQFFYATNRANTPDTFNEYGNHFSPTISTGTFDVRISPNMRIQPRIWFDKDNMQLAARQETSQAELISQLHKAVQASPNKSILIMVWGFRDWFRSAALKTAYTAYVLDINTPVLLFDWPGNQGEGRSGYLASQVIATQSAPDLGRTLALVMRYSGAKHIWLVGSSLGCQTIADSFTWLKTQPDLKDGVSKIDHVILSAPDVSADAFNEEFSEKMRLLSRHLTTYVSSNDRALLMSAWINRGRRLGRKSQVMLPPEARSEEYEFEEAQELLDLQAKGMANSSVVDATPINRTRNLHHFFTDSPEFFDDLYRRLLQPDNNVSRPLHSVRTKQDVTYWILWNN